MPEDLNVNVNIRKQGRKAVLLKCNWCKEDHLVEPGYREEVLKRGVERLAELATQVTSQEDKVKVASIKPEETWTCGRCFLVLSGMPVDSIRTDCHEHEVPKEQR